MNREELIDRICPADATYECGQVGCSSNCEKCEEVLNALLNEYEKQIKADAIDECLVIVKFHANSYDGIFWAIRELERLKEQNSNKLGK